MRYWRRFNDEKGNPFEELSLGSVDLFGHFYNRKLSSMSISYKGDQLINPKLIIKLLLVIIIN